MARGILADRKQRLGLKGEPAEEELADVFEATLTLLYRLLFLLYAESRDLLPIRETAYEAASLKKIKEEVAEKAGVAEVDVSRGKIGDRKNGWKVALYINGFLGIPIRRSEAIWIKLLYWSIYWTGNITCPFWNVRLNM